MARIFIDGAESQDAELWTAMSQCALSSTAVDGFKGGYSWYCNDNDSYLYKTFASSYSQMNVAFKVYGLFSSSNQFIAFFDSALAYLAVVTRNTTSKFLEYRIGNSAAAVVVTGTTEIVNSVCYLIEVQFVPLNSGGSFTLKVNGVVDIEYTDEDTVPAGGAENIKKVLFGAMTAGDGCFNDLRLDDFIFDDADWIGNTYIQKLQISEAGTTAQWDPSTGANYACVDEIPSSDTDYITTNVTNEIDTYACANLTGSIEAIRCLQLEAKVAYAGEPTPTHVQLGVRSGGTNYFATDLTIPGLSFETVYNILEEDPNATAAWTETTLNAVEIGVKATA